MLNSIAFIRELIYNATNYKNKKIIKVRNVGMAFVNEINIIDICSKADWVVFSLSIIVTLLSIWYGSKIKSKKDECFSAGNRIGDVE